MRKKTKTTKEPLTSDDFISRLEEIKDDMKTIGVRATWMLGVLVLFILGLTNVLFKVFDVQLEVGSFARVLWATAGSLCGYYLLLLLVYIPLLILPNFGEPIFGTREDKVLQKNIGQNSKILQSLYKHFKTLIYLFILSIPAFSSIAVLLYFVA